MPDDDVGLVDHRHEVGDFRYFLLEHHVAADKREIFGWKSLETRRPDRRRPVAVVDIAMRNLLVNPLGCVTPAHPRVLHVLVKIDDRLADGQQLTIAALVPHDELERRRAGVPRVLDRQGEVILGERRILRGQQEELIRRIDFERRLLRLVQRNRDRPRHRHLVRRNRPDRRRPLVRDCHPRGDLRARRTVKGPQGQRLSLRTEIQMGVCAGK